MNWSRRRVLGGSLGLLTSGVLAPGRVRAAGSPSLLIWWCGGGWDPTYVFDPHPGEDLAQDASASVVSSGGLTWASSSRRPSVDRFFASHGSRALIINGIGVGSISHESAAILSLTGGRSRAGTDLPTVVAAETGDTLALPSINLGGPRYPGALGEFLTPINPLMTGTLAGSLPASGTVDSTQEALIQAYLAEEGVAWAEGPKTQAWRNAHRRLQGLEGEADALVLSESPTPGELRDVAVAALSRGLTRSILLPSPLPNQRFWDSHFENDLNQNDAFETGFEALCELLDTMATTAGPGGSSLLDETVVLVMSEMGRAPVLNSAQGKDHWPTTSWMVLGRDLDAGRVIGGTTGALVGRPTNLDTGLMEAGGTSLRPGHVLAGLVAHLGVDPSPWFPETPPLRL